MKQETELGWLRLANKTDLVLTTLHVTQHQDRGIFGESQAIIPRGAITNVRISWQRSRALVALGTILLLIFVVLLVGSSIAETVAILPREVFFSPATPFWQYGSLILAIGIFVLFWFYKESEIEITASNATLGGTPRSYEEAQQFCSLLLSEAQEKPMPAKEVVKEAPTAGQPAESEWKL